MNLLVICNMNIQEIVERIENTGIKLSCNEIQPDQLDVVSKVRLSEKQLDFLKTHKLQIIDFINYRKSANAVNSHTDNALQVGDLNLVNSETLEKYGNKTELELVNEAKADFSRRVTGKRWHNKEEKQVKIHDQVTAKMRKNEAFGDEQWFERELINTKWISVNCNTSMSNGDFYMAKYQAEVDRHNAWVRMVSGKDLGRYFNRSARAAKRKASDEKEIKRRAIRIRWI